MSQRPFSPPPSFTPPVSFNLSQLANFIAAFFDWPEWNGVVSCLMAKPAKKKKAMILGVGLDSDGNKRITTGPNFTLLGGTEETHELMTEKAMKINEKLKSRGKQLEEVSAAEFNDIAGEVGLQQVKRRS